MEIMNAKHTTIFLVRLERAADSAIKEDKRIALVPSFQVHVWKYFSTRLSGKQMPEV